MASTSAISLTSLPATLCQAITFLTRPLLNRYSAITIQRLQTALGANLTALYTPIWYPSEPLRGSGRRCLTFSPSCLPPRAVHNACTAAHIQWSDWIALLGGAEFDMFIDPGCISVRVSGRSSKLVTIWSEELEAEAAVARQVREQRKESLLRQQELLVKARREQEREQALLKLEIATKKKTLAQQLLESDDSEEEELFSMLNDEIRAPTWMTPILEQFPVVPEPNTVPQLKVTFPSRSSFSHSRTSSSDSLSALSFTSDESDVCSTFSSISLSTAPSSVASSCASSTAPSEAGSRRSRKETRQPRVFIDTSKKEVTPYDGGKTTVLTGGVMLGAPAAGTKAASKWRN